MQKIPSSVQPLSCIIFKKSSEQLQRLHLTSVRCWSVGLSVLWKENICLIFKEIVSNELQCQSCHLVQTPLSKVSEQCRQSYAVRLSWSQAIEARPWASEKDGRASLRQETISPWAGVQISRKPKLKHLRSDTRFDVTQLTWYINHQCMRGSQESRQLQATFTER